MCGEVELVLTGKDEMTSSIVDLEMSPCGDILSFNSTFFGGGPMFENDFGSSDVGVLRMRRRQMA